MASADQERRGPEARNADVKRREFKHNQFIIREGKLGDQAFIIMEGKVEILKTTEEDQKILAVLYQGAMFGEMALIDNELRMASARAVEGPATLLVVTREMFQKKLAGLDPFTRGLIRILADNVRNLSCKG